MFNLALIHKMRKADLLGANSQRSLELYIDVAIIYILLVFIIGRLGALLEKQAAYFMPHE